MTDLSELIRRVEAATGPDREIDVAIWQAATGEPPHYEDHLGEGPFVQYGDSVWWVELPALTTSLDAALSLVERRLPGRNWLIGRGRLRATEPLYGAQIMDGQAVIGEGESEHTPALALCRAMLKALDAEGSPASKATAGQLREAN